MKQTLFTVIAVVQLALSAQAGYTDKLKAIQAIVPVEFSSIMSDVEKVQAVNRLYTYLTNTPNKDVYGEKKLVQKIYVSAPAKYDNAARTAANAKLRNHSLVMTFDGRSFEMFEANVSEELSTLAQIERATAALKARYPKLTVNRESDFFEVTSTNQSYLQLLNYISQTLPTAVPAQLETQLEGIIITDSTRGYNHANAALGSSFFNKDKKYLTVEFGHTNTDNDALVADQQGFETLVKTVTLKGFNSINMNLIDAGAVNSALSDFASYLTADTEALLKANGVTSFGFKENVDTAQNLFSNGQLTLGQTLEKMNFVTDLLFR